MTPAEARKEALAQFDWMHECCEGSEYMEAPGPLKNGPTALAERRTDPMVLRQAYLEHYGARYGEDGAIEIFEADLAGLRQYAEKAVL